MPKRDSPIDERGPEAIIPPPTFYGYPPPSSNTTYTPNQFFDVVLRHSSRVVVRLVAYMLRKTLGWCDADGNPQEPRVVISYSDLIDQAGITRPHIRRALDEAIAAHYIKCIRSGRPKSTRTPAISALYELNWDHSGHYVTNPGKFQGFFAGQGNLTYIPNAFFDYTVPSEPLSVVKVVGTIIRHTIGWQTTYGFRRQQVQMSFTTLQKHTNLSRNHLNQALQHALAHNHVFRVQEGFFDPDAGKASQAAKYSIRWLDNETYQMIGYKRLPETKTPPDRLQKVTGIGYKRLPEDRLQKVTDIEITHRNKTSQITQQQDRTPGVDKNLAVVAESHSQTYQLLLDQGFNRKVAAQLAENYPEAQIQNQLNWLGKRNIARNRLGMLRRAIEENWLEPEAMKPIETEQSTPAEKGKTFAACFYAGRSGNPDAPVADPSVKESQQAEAFVNRLLLLWPEENKVSEWGREFGAMVREADRFNEKAVLSFVAALRNHGDRFYSQVKADHEKVLRRAEAEAAEAHQDQFYGAYLEYLRSEEGHYKALYPDRYAAWLERFEQFRFGAQEGEESRLKAFCQAMDLLNFWTWDEQKNPAKLETNLVKL